MRQKCTQGKGFYLRSDIKELHRIPFYLGPLVINIETAPPKTYLGIKLETKTFPRDHIDVDEEILRKFLTDTQYICIIPPRNGKLKKHPITLFLS